jgi:hypothetical protein
MNEPKKKLIEVALALEEINQAAAREKWIQHGRRPTHPIRRECAGYSESGKAPSDEFDRYK